MALAIATKKLSGRVLLVDDMTDVRLIMTKILRRMGLDVDTAADGKQAYNMALEASHSGCAFDVVLMDMHMPVMDGFSATALLRSNNYEGRIVALTAMHDARSSCLAAGCDDFATKPIEVVTLLELLTRHIHGDVCEPALSMRGAA
jgi:CheY-like chemotaxis protein